MKTKTIRIAIGVILLLLLAFWVIESVRFTLWGKTTERKCGVVTFKGNKEQIHKYSTHTEFVMVVKYYDGLVSKEVSPATWSSHEVGDRICFEERIDEAHNWIAFTKYCTVAILCVVIVVRALFLIITGVSWITTGEV